MEMAEGNGPPGPHGSREAGTVICFKPRIGSAGILVIHYHLCWACHEKEATASESLPWHWWLFVDSCVKTVANPYFFFPFQQELYLVLLGS